VKDREFRFIINLRERYTRFMGKMMGKSTKVLIIVFLVTSIGLVLGIRAISSQFLPKMDEGNLYVRITFPYSISLNKTYENAKKARDVLVALKEVETVEFQVGRPEDGT